MPRYKALLLAQWIGSGTEADPYRPIVPYAVDSVVDVVGQPSENLICAPNSLTVEVVCSEAVLATIPAALILLSEEIVEVHSVSAERQIT